MRKQLALAVCVAVGLAGCATPPAPAPSGGLKGSFRPSRYQRAAAVETPQFGEWRVLSNCRIQADAADFSVVTDGRVDGNTLRLSLVFRVDIARAPQAHVTGWQSFLQTDGRARTYAAALPYTPQSAAHMLEEDVYLGVGYQPFGSVPLESTLATRGLMYALGELGKQCP